jgi:hypothetical protein
MIKIIIIQYFFKVPVREYNCQREMVLKKVTSQHKNDINRQKGKWNKNLNKAEQHT